MQFFEITKEQRTLGNIGRCIMDLAITEKDDAKSNYMSTVGNKLTTVGATFGSRLEDFSKEDREFITSVMKRHPEIA